MTVLDDIQQPRLRQLHEYWDDLRGCRRFPARREIDPLAFPSMLGHVLLIEVLREPLRFRIRVHGTALAERAGYDLTGRMLDDLPHPEFRALAERSFRNVVETGIPFGSKRDRVIDNRSHRYETLMLPLSDAGERVDGLLIGLLYADDRAPAGQPARPTPPFPGSSGFADLVRA